MIHIVSNCYILLVVVRLLVRKLYPFAPVVRLAIFIKYLGLSTNIVEKNCRGLGLLEGIN